MSEFLATLHVEAKVKESLEAGARANGRTLAEHIATRVQFPCVVTTDKPVKRRYRRKAK